MAMKTVRFELEGDGYFPSDMLRYDQAYPCNAEAVHALNGRHKETIKVLFSLKMDRPKKAILELIKRQAVPSPRWASFGWHITRVWFDGTEVK